MKLETGEMISGGKTNQKVVCAIHLGKWARDLSL
jgi:hypothetical protein